MEWDKKLGLERAGDIRVAPGSQGLETGHPMGQNTATPQRGSGPSPHPAGKQFLRRKQQPADP